jgi:hypothetical protein
LDEIEDGYYPLLLSFTQAISELMRVVSLALVQQGRTFGRLISVMMMMKLVSNEALESD